ncbi:hypothetical protein KP509_25G031500 [Ceratopteris richardii]|uniref:Uncharacterized protein n=1 Tax=Ceratopteris richardii TaxID=49495 RepID=A0A8T2RP37_CERRI|nr:hypothetical protein KP509_25G031500 [Ceratopteris richardii]
MDSFTDQERTPAAHVVKQKLPLASPVAKPPFRVVADDSKPLLRDLLLRSDPIEAEQVLLRPPPLSR